MFDVCTTGDTTHIDPIFKLLPLTRQHGYIDILHCCNENARINAAGQGRVINIGVQLFAWKIVFSEG
jgi:hypothetical protein